MAKVGDLERLVEGLVGRGLVAPKFVGRQIGQAAIDEISNLGSNIAQSQATRQQQVQQQKAKFFGQTRPISGPSARINPFASLAIDPLKPFAVGRETQGGSTAIARLTNTGVELDNAFDSPALQELALKNTLGQVPDITKIFVGKTVRGLEELRAELFNALKPDQKTGIFKNF